MSGFGSGGFGLSPWGGGAGASFDLLGADAVSETVVRLLFSEPPYQDGVGGVGDAFDPDNYTVTATSGTGLDGKAIRTVLAISASVLPYPVGQYVDVTVDRPFSPYPCLYLVSCTGLRGAVSGLPLTAGSTAASFHGMLRTVESQDRSLALKNRDVASPQSPADTMDPLPDPMSAVLGSFNTDSTGDYAFDEGVTGYRKRNLRRTYCRKRRFVFLPPTWGAGVVDELKHHNSAAVREAIRADIEQQWLDDPETKTCTVTTVLDATAPQLVRYRIQARLGDGRSLNLTLPFQLR